MSVKSQCRRDERSAALAWCLAAYLVAGYVALGVGYCLADQGAVSAAFWADVAATVAIFAFSFGFGNSSLYDAYWSVAPLPIALYWAWSSATPGVNNTRVSVVVVLVAVWGVRLTHNWYRRWGGLRHEDWRYVDLRRKTGALYWPVSLLGLHLMPTLVVFAACLPLYPATALGTREFGILDAAATGVTLFGVAFETIADEQLRRFSIGGRASEGILDTGLWTYSRHPNYFGEITFWWGLWLFGLAAAPSYWWTLVGPLAITLLFQYVSLPLIERRMLERRPNYARRVDTVSAILPRRPKPLPPPGGEARNLSQPGGETGRPAIRERQ